MPANTWTPGTLYLPGGPGGFFRQPGGPFTVVEPQVQVQASSDYLSTKAFSELTGTYVAYCSHSFMYVSVQTDWDYTTNMSVALLLCPICSAILRQIEPASDALGPGMAATLLNSILFA
jgi:hypothetical protein